VGPLSGGEALVISHRGAISPHLQALAEGLDEFCLSDFSFANLLMFRHVHDYRFHSGDWPGVSGLTYDRQPHFFPLFGVGSAPAQVLDDLIATHGCLYPVAQPHLQGLNASRYEWQAERDDADYLYPRDNFIGYAGRVLQKKRNLMRQVLRSNAVQRVSLESTTGVVALGILERWMLEKGKAAGDADHGPCVEALQDPARFGLRGFMYLVNDDPAGFVLAQSLRPSVCVVRFAKGGDQFKGIYPYMFHDLAMSLPASVRYLNFEQDMGVANLRRTKLSYGPCSLLPKFRVSRRSA